MIFSFLNNNAQHTTKPANVIPAKAGIHELRGKMDSSLRWNDTILVILKFCRV